MADPRTFVLIGEFKDGITPELQKINNQLAALKSSFSNIGGKGARNASRDLGRFAAASQGVTNALKEQNQALRSAIEPLRQYRSEVGKTVAAMKKLQSVRGGAKGIEETNRALEQQIRLMRQLQSLETRQRFTRGAGGGGRPPRPPRTPDLGGGGMPAGRPTPGGARGRGGGGLNGSDYNMATFSFAFSLGQGLSQPITNAIVAGFQIGVGLMTRPFEYFANAFGERVQDELSDLKAAGGLFSISKRSQNPFLKDIDEAIQFQQDTNKTFAKMAAALPGVTNDYVQVGKRLSDTAARIVNKDFSGALAEANKVRATAEGAKFYGQQITGTGPEAQREVITTLLGELTKKTTIAGLGGRTGAGGIAGAYGLPGITERLLSEDAVSVGKFQRYASVFSDPTVADALQRNVDKINATAMNSVERYRVIQKVLDEIVTPELIEKLRTSVDGIYQGLKSMIFDPDTGLFGLGRNFEKFGKRINQYGQYVDKAGNVVTDIARAADEDLSLFEIVRDIFSNLGQALMPIVEVLPQIFDPLKNVAKVLMDVRHYAAEFNRTFNEYREGFKELAKIPGNEFLKESLDIRSSLAAINNLFAEFGIITENEFLQTANMLKSKDLDIGATVSKMIDQFFDSDLAEKVGEIVGRVIGTVLSEVAKMTGFLADKVGGNKLTSGFKKGFEAAGGPKAFTAIFEDVFKLMFEGLKFVMKALPWQAYALMAAAVVLPAAISGLGMLIAQGIAGALSRALSGKAIEGFMGRAVNFLRNFLVKPIQVKDVTAPVITDPRRMLPPGKTPPALPSAALAKETAKAPGIFAKLFAGLKKFWKIITLPMKALGRLNIAVAALTGVIEFVTAIFTGSDLAEALGKTAGPVIGSIIGGALLGPLGAAIGGWIGSMKPVVDTFTGIFKGIGWALQNAWAAIGPSLEALGGIVQTLWNAFVGLIPGMDRATAGLDMLNFAFIAVKVALFPFVSILNGVAFALQLLKLGLLKFDLWVNKTFQWGDREGRLKAQINKTQREMEETALRQKRINEDLLKPLEDKTKKKTAAGAKPTPPTPTVAPTPASLSAFSDLYKPKTTPAGPAAPAKHLSAFSGMFNEPKKAVTPAPSLSNLLATAPKPAPAKAAVKPAAEIQQTAKNTFQLNQKAAQQVSAINATKNAANATKTATEATKNAVVAQKATLGTIQTTLSAMYGLLASGMLRVQTQMGMNGIHPGGFLPPGYIPPNLNPKKGQVSFPGIGESPKIGYQGHLGDAISQEMKHKPPGSDLVVANTSETIIPAAGGYGMKEFVQSLDKLSGAVAQVKYGGGKKPGGGASNWMQILEEDYQRNLNKPISPGTPKNSGRGHLDTWGGPQASYVSPQSLQVASKQGMAASGPINITSPITINQQPGQDADALATIVAMKIGEAVADARAASLFV